MDEQLTRANVVEFRPRPALTIDARKLLVEKQSKPTVALPPNVRKALDRRARELAEEAFVLCKTHLERRVAFHCEGGSPRFLLHEKALEIIAEGDLGHALARAYYDELGYVLSHAKAAERSCSEFVDKLLNELGVARDADE